MSVTLYTCDTCKRELEVVQNDSALSLVQNCVITQGCKGSLYKTGVRPNGVIGKQTPVVEGLSDYKQQGRLFIHEQTLPSSAWVINHDLNTNPIVYTYLKAIDGQYTQLDQDQYVVNIIDQNNITVEFADNSIGIVHIIARPNIDQPPVEAAPVETQQFSANTIWTIASPILEEDELVQAYDITFTSPSNSQSVTVPVEFTAHKKDDNIALFNTPWRNAQLVVWNDKLYRVRSVRITNVTNANPIEDGSPFYFVDNPNIIILSSSAPYETDTDINNKVVYVPDLPQNAFTRNRFNESELVIETGYVTDIFPALQVYKTISQ